MLDSLIFVAFAIGIVSACSLPLGALTAQYWQPRDRTAGAIVAFGSGALLAALTIDMVAPAFGRGHYYAVASGCILGGLLFVTLNEVVNNYGGFLRKVSTTVYHLRRQEHRRFKHILSHLGRIDIFKDLATNEFKVMSEIMALREVAQGTSLYQLDDPADALYIVVEGEIQLLDPQNGMRVFETLKTNDAFGRMAFLTGRSHATVAQAHTHATVWVLPRRRFDQLLAKSSALSHAMCRWLHSDELLTYLQQRHGMNTHAASAWVAEMVKRLEKDKLLPPLSDIERNQTRFIQGAPDISRLPIFSDLSEDGISTIASRLVYKTYRRGESFYHKDEPADRMFVIERGEVSLLDPDNSAIRSKMLTDHDAFAGLSFLTGTHHTTSAVATRDTTVWVLLKYEFDELLQQVPELEQRVADYLQQEDIEAYLEQKQHFDASKAMYWINTAVKNIDAGRLIPAADELATKIHRSKGAPLAIWLGILLDGVPESLVIGASLLYHDISLALVAGLFLSNYPEALFSSIGMRQQGMTYLRIGIMWTSIMLFTGIGAALGNLFFVDAHPFAISIVEGIAAGAMLTMIAQTMLPEAYFKGGSIIGFATLLGFLAALFFKSIG
ncbi:MAG: cyclic nucleotide-binding domain-containing protein [Gammaproteobacteria bacterium]|nr:cyclic nucleotide-binding domain-containing protein [Gammaproteobacteria bacterium]